MAVTRRDVDDDVRRYVQNHRDDLLYAIQHGDPFVQSLAIAALLRGGDAELELAKRELERLQEEER
jgi:hypothetical protein